MEKYNIRLKKIKMLSIVLKFIIVLFEAMPEDIVE